MLRSGYALLIILLAIGMYGCKRQVANNSANDNTAAVSPFASITDANAALAEGNRLLDTNQTELAIEAYKRAVEIDPDLAEAYFKMGIGYALLEMEAKQNGGNQILPGEVDPNTKTQAKPNSIKMFERAVEAYKKQLNGSSKDAAGYFNLGLAYNKLNRDDAAEDALAMAVKINPDDAEYQTELGAIRIKLAKYHEAIAALKKALEIDPDSTEAADLLEEADAGARRVDYVGTKPDSNKANSNNANAANSSTNSAANTAPPSGNAAAPANKKPVDDKIKKTGPTPKPRP